MSRALHIYSVGSSGIGSIVRRALVLASLISVGLAFTSAPVRAASKVHAVYVGVAEYKFGRPTVPGANFENLRAAPRDIDTIRRVIEPRVSMGSIQVLMGPQATRDAIIAALNRLSSGAQGQPGDTFIFYYTGHGGRLPDPTGDQPSGYHSTIVPYDARDPSKVIDGVYGDITDTELREHIAAIAARGLNVVSILDSCNSGTATRSPVRPTARQKSVIDVPRTSLVRLARPKILRGPTARPGYVVHFAAAADRATAWEDEANGVVRSDFTEALAQAILRSPTGATYQDVFVEARRHLLQMGLAANDQRNQQPLSEGELRSPFMGDGRPATRVFEARKQSDGKYKLDAGRFAGAAAGSVLSLYSTVYEAFSAQGRPVAEARIVTVRDWDSDLHLISDPPSPAERFYAVEKSRAYGAASLRIRLIGAAVTDARLRSVLAPLTFLDPNTSNGAYGLQFYDGRLSVFDAAGNLLRNFDGANLAPVSSFLEGLARYHALLALTDEGEKLKVDFEIVAESCAGETVPAAKVEGGEPKFAPGNLFFLRLRNHENREVYPYVVRLASDYGVRLIDPPPGFDGQTLQPAVLGKPSCYARKYRATGRGRDHLLLIVADRPLPGIQNLQQGALRGGLPSNDPLDRLLREVASGRRGGEVVGTGQWNARVISFSVQP